MTKKHTHIRVSTETHDLLREIRAAANLLHLMAGKDSLPSMSAIVHDALLEYQRNMHDKWRGILGDELLEQTLAIDRLILAARDAKDSTD